MLALAFATARWGRRAALLGWLGGLGLLLGAWVVVALGAGLQTGFGSPAATTTAGFAFAIVVVLLGGIWLVAGAVAAAFGLVLHTWLRLRRPGKRS